MGRIKTKTKPLKLKLDELTAQRKADLELVEKLKAELAAKPTEATEREAILSRLHRYIKRWQNAFPAVLGGGVVPLPEAVSQDDERWTLETSKHPFCDLIGHRMGTFSGETAFSRATRIEELLHAMYSIPLAEGEWAKFQAKVARAEVLQVAEDFRIKHIAAYGLTEHQSLEGKFASDRNLQKGARQQFLFNIRNTLLRRPDPQMLVKAFNPYPLADFMCGIASVYPLMVYCTDWAWDTLDESLDKYFFLYEVPREDQEIIWDFRLEVRTVLSDYRNNIVNSTFSSTRLGPAVPGTTARLPNVTHYLAKALEQALDKADKELTASLRNRLDRMLKKQEERRKRKESNGFEDNPLLTPKDVSSDENYRPVDDATAKDKGYKWAKGKHSGERSELRSKLLKTGATMKVIKPPLHRRLLFNWKQKYVARQGVQIRRIENLHLDPFSPPIFANKAKQNSVHPFVLLDASGSMGMTLDKIRNLVEQAKGATVAYYSGNDRERGEVVVVSDKGRFCTQTEFAAYHHGGNTVDFLAYDWVLKNYPQRPIHWITDQAYTWHKRYEGCSDDLTRYAKLHGTKYHRSIKEFIAYWKKAANCRR